MLGFGKGARRCLGEGVAWAEMRMVVRAVLGWEMELWETDGRDVAFAHDWQVAHPWRGSRGIRAVVRGRVEGWEGDE